MRETVRLQPVTTDAGTHRRPDFSLPAVPAVLRALVLFALVTGPAHAQNRVANPGFEYGTNPWIGNWTTAGGGYSGVACGSAQVPSYGSVGQSLFGKLEPGRTYTLSAWMKTTLGVGQKARMTLFQVDSGGGMVTTLLETGSLSAAWAQYTASFTLNVSGTLSAVEIRFTNDVFPVSALELLVDDVSVTGSSTLDVSGPGKLSFELDGAQPNPSRADRLEVSFTLPTSDPARIELLDLGGRRVAAREVGWLGAGRHTVDFAEGRRVAPGLYFARLSQAGHARTVRVAVVP